MHLREISYSIYYSKALTKPHITDITIVNTTKTKTRSASLNVYSLLLKYITKTSIHRSFEPLQQLEENTSANYQCCIIKTKIKAFIELQINTGIKCFKKNGSKTVRGKL